ncbi:MAG TPA: hypothetical protein PK812_10255 [Beijerinckiaceae bacterium]|nr:hypothetical protein [Beijerinckiaceae bacterium]
MTADHSRLKAELRAIPKAELKRFWADLGYILLPAAPEWRDRPETDLQRERLLSAVTEALAEDIDACPDLAPHPGPLPASGQREQTIAAIVRDFYDLIPTSPVNAKKGGNGFNGCLQVYAVARLLNPKVIIESGVFRGQTTWILRQACPKATIFCFDVDFSNLVYKDREAIYTQSDWSGFDLAGLPTDETLAFFDDHIDQGRRVLEAQVRGLSHLLFDDNASASRIHTVGGPPIPSLDMLMDPALDGQTLAWTYRGKRYGCAIDAAQAQQVRKAVATMRNFADMHRVTGYTPARITYVSLCREAKA